MSASSRPSSFAEAAIEIQERVATEILSAFDRNQDVIAVSPTGSGKTNIFTVVAASVYERDADARILFLQNRKLQAIQNEARAHKLGIAPGETALIFDGKLPQDIDRATYVYALSQTLVDHVEQIGSISHVVIDEAHGATNDENNQTRQILDALKEKNPGLRIAGFTATPFPPDGLELDERLTRAHRIVVTYKEAIAAGMIVPIRTVRPDHPLTNGHWLRSAIEAKIDIRHPERTVEGLNSLIRSSRPENFHDIVLREIRKEGADRMSSLVFCDTIKEAQDFCGYLTTNGMSATAIHSKMPKSEINAAIEAYREDRVRILCSVDMIGQGFDAPNTGSVINLKATTSLTEHLQIAGRAMRIFEGRMEGLLMDFGASTALYGTIEQYIETQHYLEAKAEMPVWTLVSKDPFVRSVCLGRDVYYASPYEGPNGKRSIYVAQSYTDDKTQSRRLLPVGSMGSRELSDFIRSKIAEDPVAFNRATLHKRYQADGREIVARESSYIVANLYKHECQKLRTMVECLGTPLTYGQLARGKNTPSPEAIDSRRQKVKRKQDQDFSL